MRFQHLAIFEILLYSLPSFSGTARLQQHVCAIHRVVGSKSPTALHCASVLVLVIEPNPPQELDPNPALDNPAETHCTNALHTHAWATLNQTVPDRSRAHSLTCVSQPLPLTHPHPLHVHTDPSVPGSLRLTLASSRHPRSCTCISHSSSVANPLPSPLLLPFLDLSMS